MVSAQAITLLTREAAVRAFRDFFAPVTTLLGRLRALWLLPELIGSALLQGTTQRAVPVHQGERDSQAAGLLEHIQPQLQSLTVQLEDLRQHQATQQDRVEILFFEVRRSVAEVERTLSEILPQVRELSARVEALREERHEDVSLFDPRRSAATFLEKLAAQEPHGLDVTWDKQHWSYFWRSVSPPVRIEIDSPEDVEKALAEAAKVAAKLIPFGLPEIRHRK